MKYLLLAFSLLALSEIAQAGNWNKSSSLNLKKSTISSTTAPENFLIPADVMSKFKALPMKTKKKFCSANRRSKNLFYNTKPILKIKGYNSRMDNSKSVIGGESSGKFARSASVMLTSLWALEDDFNKELAFNNLYKWAEADAWGKTRRCYLNGSCGTYWARKDGQDPFPGHDDNQAALYVFHIAYAYHVTFADYYPADDRHITIKKWINKWVKTRMSVNDGFGNDSGWRIPDIFANARQGEVNKNKIVNLLSFIDKNILDDGSIKNRTTRGNRSLWYHHASMAEIMIGLEIANSVGIEIPQSLLNKIEKAKEAVSEENPVGDENPVGFIGGIFNTAKNTVKGVMSGANGLLNSAAINGSNAINSILPNSDDDDTLEIDNLENDSLENDSLENDSPVVEVKPNGADDLATAVQRINKLANDKQVKQNNII